MKKRRRLVVDKKFQLTIAASLTAIAGMIISTVIIITAAITLYNNNKLDVLVNNHKVLSENQDELFKTMIHFSRIRDLKNIWISVPAVQKDMNQNKTRLDETGEIIQSIGKSNRNLIIILVIFAVIQSILLFYFIIKRTLRISGPVYLLNTYIDDIKKGKSPTIRPMRRNDDFKDLFVNFREMVELLKNKKKISISENNKKKVNRKKKQYKSK